MLKDIIEKSNFALKKQTSNEWATACPKCGGNDRFRVFANGGRDGNGHFWCRQCGFSGDSLSWKIDVLGKNPVEVLSGANGGGKKFASKPVLEWDLTIFSKWAKNVVKAGQNHLKDLASVEFYKSRGLTLKTAESLKLGWVPKDVFFPAKQTGRAENRAICLPCGALLPVYSGSEVLCLLVRRNNKSEWGKWGKWAQIGKRDAVFLSGCIGAPLVICESILDAASVYQATCGKWAAMALLGSTKSALSEQAQKYLVQAHSVLICGDDDEGGAHLCSMMLEKRSDAYPWRSKIYNDLNDILINEGDTGLEFFLEAGKAQISDIF